MKVAFIAAGLKYAFLNILSKIVFETRQPIKFFRKKCRAFFDNPSMKSLTQRQDAAERYALFPATVTSYERQVV